jgi:hypothetical protein
MAASHPEAVSMLLVEEYFDREDERFIDALREVSAVKPLAGFAQRWKKDHRPWARRQVFRYLELPLDRKGHEPVVKQLFKQAEENRDDELMAAFLAAFDAQVRYERTNRWHYDWQTRQTWQEESLRLPRNNVRFASRRGSDYRLFRYRTRYYLRRRAWRYFRQIGFSRPAEYCRAVSRALVRYVDDDLVQGEDILESWGLMHVCFGKSALLEKSAAHITLKEGATLAELATAPYFPELWRADAGFLALLSVLEEARSKLVRTWSMQLLEREHAERLESIDVRALLQLLNHRDPAVSAFAARQFGLSKQVASLTLDAWFKLLEVENI